MYAGRTFLRSLKDRKDGPADGRPGKRLPSKQFILTKLKWIAALACLLVIIYGSYTLSRYVVSEKVENEPVEVVIDSGHGGDDPGKIGVNEALEKDINLAIALKVEKLLKKEGISVLMTRREDRGLEPEGSRNKKVEDMKARVKLINETAPQLAVSIHQNSYQSGDVKGAQVFYFTHSSEGKQVAETIQNSLEALDAENHRKAKANDTYYLLKRTEVPTVIVECGFLSNWEEAQRLTEDEYQQKVAEAVYSGIMECLGKGGNAKEEDD